MFGELQEGWVSAVFQGTIQQDDLRMEGTAQDSVMSISIKDNYLVDREIRFIIKSTDDNGFIIETEVVPAVLIYEDGRWHEDNKNI